MLIGARLSPRLIACLLAAGTTHAAQIIRESLPTSLVSAGAVEYAILLPDSYSPDGERFPLLLLLHGAGGDREQIARIEPQISEMWASNGLPPMVVVTPSVATGSIYLDSYDGKERWESFLMDEFLPHLRARYRVSRERETTMVSGGSMGGLGSLRLGFKYPETFGAIAAMQPGAWPGVTWDEVPDRNKIRPPERIANLFGDPFDDKRFLRENPASIVERDPSRLLGSAIYIEVGEQDGFGFVEGADFMHRLLWRHRILARVPPGPLGGSRRQHAGGAIPRPVPLPSALSGTTDRSRASCREVPRAHGGTSSIERIGAVRLLAELDAAFLWRRRRP